MSAIGFHFIADFYDCDPTILNDKTRIHKILESAAVVSDATIIKIFLNKFSPRGISGTVVTAECHLSIHTWPEHNFAAVDLFIRDGEIHPYKSIHFLEAELRCKHTDVKKLDRGSYETRNEE